MKQTTRQPDSPNTLISGGTLLLWSGILIFVVAFLQRQDAFPFKLPRTWYTNFYLWMQIGVICFVWGCYKLIQRPKVEHWEPAHGGNPFNSLVLYTREDCHLCSQAKDMLWEYNDYLPDIEEVDIDEDSILSELFCDCVPVVEIDGKIRFRGQINELLLRRLIENGLHQ